MSKRDNKRRIERVLRKLVKPGVRVYVKRGDSRIGQGYYHCTLRKYEMGIPADVFDNLLDSDMLN